MKEEKENIDACSEAYNNIRNFVKKYYIWLVLFGGFLILVIIGGSYFYYQYSNIFLDNEKILGNLGVAGDFLAGMLNPIFAFLSFCLLLITIKLQDKELKNSTKELKKSSKALKKQSKSLKIQNFENTFFNMISLHNEIVNSSSLSVLKKYFELIPETVHSFRLNSIIPEDRKKYFYRIGDLKVNIEEDKEYNGRKTLYQLFTILNQFIKDYIYSNNNQAIGLYNAFHSEYSQIINHYFRNIYHILKIIEEEDDFDIDKKKYYTNILRAQISNYELALIFMNAIYRKEDSKLFPLLVKFEFMEPLNFVIAEPYNSNVTFHKYLIDETYLIYVIKDYLKKIKEINYEDKIFGSNNNMKEYLNYINKATENE
ncbi:hypothetical protein AF79_09140 [Aliarcobacter butzleri L354]|uniref:putative phage abortive infection protein n=1 Tax=Aliarcobacter butzleri TaxID=28197 RepID=UPI00063A91BB|nr:putative phage abortive infection protein [Aliarcobacter butzleri]KLE08116.1 hypothetical protein AF79_09140 [Aliarcobacter butzleri L354]